MESLSNQTETWTACTKKSGEKFFSEILLLSKLIQDELDQQGEREIGRGTTTND